MVMQAGYWKLNAKQNKNATIEYVILEGSNMMYQRVDNTEWKKQPLFFPVAHSKTWEDKVQNTHNLLSSRTYTFMYEVEGFKSYNNQEDIIAELMLDYLPT